MGTQPSPHQTCTRCRVFPNHKNTFFPPNTSLPLKVMILLGLWERFCPRANLQPGVCAWCWGHRHRQISSGCSGCPVGSPWPWQSKTGSHEPQQSKGALAGLVCTYTEKKKKKRSGEKPLSSAGGIRIYCHIRWIQVNEKLRPHFISADNKTSFSHN